VIGRNGEIAEYMEHMASTDCESVYGRNNRLGHIADQTVECLDLEKTALGRTVITSFLPLLLIPPGTKGPVSCSCKSNDTYGPVGPRGLETENEFINRPSAKRIVALGSVNSNPSQASIDLK
jgi:hypothetical protein